MKTKAILLAFMAFSAAGSFADSYKWTGAVSSDFADADNWLKDEGGAWVATETPPANAYNTDDIYFDGVASECPNMPVLSTRWLLRRVYFLTGGWTISATTVEDTTGDLQLVKGYGGTGGSGIYHGVIDDTAIHDTSSDGLTNTISCLLYQPGGLRVSVSEGAALEISGKIDIVDTGTGLGSQSKRMGFFGGGDLTLSGDAGNTKLGRQFEMGSGCLYLAKTSGASVSGAFDAKGGKVIVQGDGQVGGGTLYISGDTELDLGGFDFAPEDIYFGAKYSGTSTAWTGTISGLEKLRTTANDKGIVVTPLSKKVVLLGFPGPAGWKKNSDNRKIRVGDILGEDEELVLNGPLFNTTKGNNGGSVYFNGLEIDGETTYGSVSLNAATGFGGIYTRAFISTTLYVNHTTEESSSLGNPLTIKVNPGTGILRGDGVVTPYAGDANQAPAVNVYGTLSPGSISNPAGTLGFQRSGNNTDITVTMRTNSVFRIEADANGDCPKVVQNDGTFALEQPPEGAEETIVAPKIVIGGTYAPAAGWHRVLTVKGTMTGEFSSVSTVEFENAAKYRAVMRTVEDADGKHIEVKATRGGLVICIR